jgi:hypothetical protein
MLITTETGDPGVEAGSGASCEDIGGPFGFLRLLFLPVDLPISITSEVARTVGLF